MPMIGFTKGELKGNVQSAEVCLGDENITYEEVDPLKILELKRRHASKIILEVKPVCPGDEEPTKPSEEEKPVCPGDENITYEEVDPLKIIEFKRSHASTIILEDKPVCPGDEEPTKPSEDEKTGLKDCQDM